MGKNKISRKIFFLQKKIFLFIYYNEKYNVG